MPTLKKQSDIDAYYAEHSKTTPTKSAERGVALRESMRDRKDFGTLPVGIDGDALAKSLRARAEQATDDARELRVRRHAVRTAAAEAFRDVHDDAADPLYLILGPKASTPDDETPQEVDELPERLARAEAQKARSAEMADFLEGAEGDVASKLRSCGSVRVYRHWLETGDLRLRAMYTCKQDRLCPQCAALRAAKYAAAYADKCDAVTDLGDAGWHLWTYTIANGDDLAERLHHLLDAFRDCLQARRKSRSASGRHGWSPLAGMVGGVYSVEVIRGQGGGWHPHLHLLALHDEEPIWTGTRGADVSEWWERTTGDSFIVDCRPVDDLPGACCEVLKYAMKFGGMSCSDNWAAYLATRGQRLMASLGCLRGVNPPDNLLDALSDDDGPWLDLVYRYDYAARKYDHKETRSFTPRLESAYHEAPF